MDGISDDRLWMERLTDVELQKIHYEYLIESVDVGFYVGKRESWHWKTLMALGKEMEIRRAAV